MNKLIARIKVLLKAVPTYGVVAVVVVTTVADQIANELDADAAAMVTKIAARVVAGITAIVAIARRVTPVDRNERGLLVPPAKS